MPWCFQIQGQGVCHSYQWHLHWLYLEGVELSWNVRIPLFAHFCNRLTISSAGAADADRYVADLHEPNAALISFTAASSGKSPGLLLKDEVSFCANA